MPVLADVSWSLWISYGGKVGSADSASVVIVQARAAKEAQREAKRVAKERELAEKRRAAGVEDEAPLHMAPLEMEQPVSPVEARRAGLPKLSLPLGRRPSGGVTPKDTARTTPDRAPRSPGVLYVDNI